MSRTRAGLPQQILRYGLVGGVGFVVDAGLLYALIAAGGDPYLSRVGSFAVAVTATWALNRRWTFGQRGRTGAARSYLGYALVQIGGAAANFLVYAAVLGVVTPTPSNAVLALAAGSIIGLAVNFTGARLVFTRAGPRLGGAP